MNKTKKTLIALSMGALSVSAYANFIAVINVGDFLTIGDGNSGGGNPVVPCEGGELTRSELDTKIANGDDVTKACVGTITDFSNLFSSYANFNQDISNWDVSSGENFTSMFEGNSVFGQDLSKWDVSSGTKFNNFLRNSTMLPTANLNGWEVNGELKWSFLGAKLDGQINNWKVNINTTNESAFRNASSTETFEMNNWIVTGSGAQNASSFFYNAVMSGSMNNWVLNNVDMYMMFQSSTIETSANLNNWQVKGGSLVSLFQSATVKGSVNDWTATEIDNASNMFHSGVLESTGLMNNWTVSFLESGEGSAESMIHYANVSGSMSEWVVSGAKKAGFMFFSMTLNNVGSMNNWTITGDATLATLAPANSMFLLGTLNGSMSGWTMAELGNTQSMFARGTVNSNITDWDLSDFTNYKEMFDDAVFDQDISHWDTTKATNWVDFTGGSSNLSDAHNPFFGR